MDASAAIRSRTRLSPRQLLGAVALYAAANGLAAWMLGPVAVEPPTAPPDPYFDLAVASVEPPSTSSLRRIILFFNVNAVVTCGIVLFLFLVRLEARRRTAIGLPPGLCERRVFNATGLGVVVPPPASGRPRGAVPGPRAKSIRFDRRGPRLSRPTTWSRRRT